MSSINGGLDVDEVSSNTLPADYVLSTDGNTVTAMPQSAGLTEYTGEGNVGDLLTTLIVDELPPQGSQKEAAGHIHLKTGVYPGSVEYVPIPTSLHLSGDTTNHRTNPAQRDGAQPATEPATELQCDSGVAFAAPNVDNDNAVFPKVENLHLRGPGSGTTGSKGFSNQNRPNAWDWLRLEDVVVQDFDIPLDLRDSHFAFLFHCHLIQFNDIWLDADKQYIRDCGFYSTQSPSTIHMTNPDMVDCHFADNVVNQSVSGTNAELLIEPPVDHVRCTGNRFNNLDGGGYAIDTTSTGAIRHFSLTDNYFKDTATFDSAIRHRGGGKDHTITANSDSSTASNSLFLGSVDECNVGPNHFPNGISDSGNRTRHKGTVMQGSAPDAANYTGQDRGVTIVDRSASPPDQYIVAPDGSLDGPL